MQERRGGDAAALLPRGLRVQWQEDGTARLVCQATGHYVGEIDGDGLHLPNRCCRSGEETAVVHTLPWAALRRADSRLKRRAG